MQNIGITVRQAHLRVGRVAKNALPSVQIMRKERRRRERRVVKETPREICDPTDPRTLFPSS